VPAERRSGRSQLTLLGEWEARDLSESDVVVAGERLTVKGRALAQVRELLAKCLVVERELLVPRPRLDVGLEDHSYSTAASAAWARASPSGASRSSARCASKPAVRARIGTAFTVEAG